MVDVPRRPGFSTGTEEFIWEGRPALRATVYMWILSLALGYGLSLVWQRILTDGALLALLSYVPILLKVFFTGTTPKWWLAPVPWIIAVFPIAWYTLSLAVTSYALSTQRMTIKTGVFFRTFDQLELFRVRDFVVDAPLYYTLLGLGHVRIISRDESLPLLTLIAQPDPFELVNIIRNKVQIRKDEVGTREIETTSA